MKISSFFGHVADRVSRAAGHPITFVFCCLLILVWGASGPMFRFSDTWQLVINTGTTIVTFLMVFLIQNSQNREGAALQAKLDELIRSSAAQNAFIGIEHLTQEEVDAFRDRCAQAARKVAGERAVTKPIKQPGKPPIKLQRRLDRLNYCWS
ncbi:MAG: low affinity iron permease family protein [Methylobacteriaceae bacterium]|nr:low affinity iron permease family protein [Methylobacteriaceae bacterium]MBV9394479.1 low affinity iron permease family protein [Methylobacteriaceae bacterium]